MCINRFVLVEAICDDCGCGDEDQNEYYSRAAWISWLREKGWGIRADKIYCSKCLKDHPVKRRCKHA